ncbi:hypothetical protein OH77DRAFT_1367730, partial [Trametes cingulata]
RPENAFILFRRSRAPYHHHHKMRQAAISKLISLEWNRMTTEEKSPWFALAAQRKLEHKQQYPHYVYRP